MCGIKASEAQWRGSTLRVCQALLKSAVLLSEIAKRLTFIFGNCILKWKLPLESVEKVVSKTECPNLFQPGLNYHTQHTYQFELEVCLHFTYKLLSKFFE